ncbi:MAG: phage major capsid protein [Comamonas sp.]|uniref:phage major capsid protein n=1 Tax=Comamonas sp. TaxID=34028 RepID=UPI002FC96419
MSDLQTVQAALDKVTDQLREHAARATSDREVHAKHREDVDQLLAKQSELQAEVQAMAQTVDKLGRGADASANAARTPGEVFTSAQGFEAFAANASGKFKTSVKAAITSGGASAGPLIQPDRIGMILPMDQRLFLRDLLNWGRTTSNAIEYVQELLYTNNAAPVAELATKPESDLTFEMKSAPVATIAHWIKASKQVLADAPMLQSYINGRLMYGLKLKEEQQLLKGSGVGLNLNGIYTQATAYANPGVTVQAETPIDRLRLAMLQVSLSEFDTDGIVLNPIDWAGIELTKTTDNAYLFASPTGQVAPTLWGRPVVATQAMTAKDFLVGAFRMGAQGWDREDANIEVSTEDGQNFVQNSVTIRCEERVGLTVFRPKAFCKGSLTITP